MTFQLQYDISSTIRLKKARMIIDRLGLGASSEIARRMKLDICVISQVMGRNPTRKISEKMAREFEQAFSLPVGWMDQPQREGEVGIRDIYDAIEIDWSDIPRFTENPLREISGCSCFRVQVNTNEMESDEPWRNIPYGSHVVVDTSITPGSQQLIVYRTSPKSAIKLGQYSEVNRLNRFVTSTNEALPKKRDVLTESSEIFGVVRQVVIVQTFLPLP